MSDKIKPVAYMTKRGAVYQGEHGNKSNGDVLLYDQSALEAARDEGRNEVRSAMLAEAAEWTGDHRWIVFKAFKSVSRRLGAGLTLLDCEAESQKARQR